MKEQINGNLGQAMAVPARRLWSMDFAGWYHGKYGVIFTCLQSLYYFLFIFFSVGLTLLSSNTLRNDGFIVTKKMRMYRPI